MHGFSPIFNESLAVRKYILVTFVNLSRPSLRVASESHSVDRRLLPRECATGDLTVGHRIVVRAPCLETIHVQSLSVKYGTVAGGSP